MICNKVNLKQCASLRLKGRTAPFSWKMNLQSTDLPFRRYLLDDSFPGDLVGPEPTTDRFIAVMHAQQEGIIPGHAVVVDPSKPFMSLGKFGSAFLQRFQISYKDTPVLRSLNIIDTPGESRSEHRALFRFNLEPVLLFHTSTSSKLEKKLHVPISTRGVTSCELNPRLE